MRTLSIVTASAAALLLAGAAPSPVRAETEEPEAEQGVRVFYVGAIELRDALTRVRTAIGPRAIAVVDGSGALVVADAVPVLDRVRDLLEDADPDLRTSEPHGPLDFAELADAPVESRTYRLDPDRAKSVLPLLRAIYRIGSVTEPTADGERTLRAAPALLDAVDALFADLGLLAAPEPEPGENGDSNREKWGQQP